MSGFALNLLLWANKYFTKSLIVPNSRQITKFEVEYPLKKKSAIRLFIADF